VFVSQQNINYHKQEFNPKFLPDYRKYNATSSTDAAKGSY